MKIILASASLARKELFSSLHLKFNVVATAIDEDNIVKNTPQQTLMARSRAKIQEILKNKTRYKNSVIITADSGIILENQLLGKPKDLKEAQKMLSSFSARTHLFGTAFNITFIHSQNNPQLTNYSGYRESKVTFSKLTQEIIKDYLKYSGSKLLSYAGAYSLISTPQNIITKIEGSLTNIIGLPLEDILPVLKRCKVI